MRLDREEILETGLSSCAVRMLKTAEGDLVIQLAGDWTVHGSIPSGEALERELKENLPVRKVAFDASKLQGWDSGLLVLLHRIHRYCRQHGIDLVLEGLPEGIRRLLKLALAVPENQDARREATGEPFLSRLGGKVLEVVASTREVLDFLGSAVLVLGRFLSGKARFRRVDLVLLLEECGARSLPIVTLISLLVGMILAFVGAVQLQMFGAQIYVADLVGIAMTREMGAIMTGIIVAGRTGAAFAAHLGTMQVNQEIDALRTLGISPMEFLVMPRVLALAVMMPLLCVYSDFMGILGGFFVGVGMLDLTFMQYWNETTNALTLTHFTIGVLKSGVFGVLVGMSGCLRGIQCERTSSAVGLAATSAVVTSIVLIILSDALFAVLNNRLGI